MITEQRRRSTRELPVTESILDRRVPYDLDAEQSLIGSCFIDAEAIDNVRGHVSADDFFDEGHKTTFKLLQELRDAGDGVDVVLFADAAKRRGLYETIGGAAAIYRMIQSVPSAAHARYYAKTVAEKAKLRGIIAACTDALRNAYEEMTPAIEILGQTEDQLLALRDVRTVKAARPITEVCHETIGEIDAAMRGEKTAAIPTGFTDLDKMLGGGFRPGELIIVAARPAMGKSALSADFATSIAQDRMVAFFSLEMTATNLCERMLSAAGEIDGSRLRNRTLSQSDQARLIQAAGEVSTLRLEIDDTSHMRVGDISASVRLIEKRTTQKVEMIVVDYLQFVAAEDPKANRELQVATTARRLKQLAKERQCPVVAVCAVNRKGEDGGDKRPKLAMLRESGSLEYEADVVLMLHRDDYYLRGEEAKEKEGLAEVIVAKQRNGPCGTVELRWDAKHTRFQNMAPERAEECSSYEPAFEEFNRGF